jgi:hypothetical protein
MLLIEIEDKALPHRDLWLLRESCLVYSYEA